MKNTKPTDPLVIKNEKKFLHKIARWVFAVVMMIVILFLLTTPLRSHGADNYVKKGDQLLSEKKYLSADLAYQKALILNPKNKMASERRDLVTKAEDNVLVLEDFYKNSDNVSQKNLFSSVSAFPANETEALKLSKELIEKGEYQLAIVPAETAKQMAPDYALCWQYLGIANQRTTELSELSPEIKEKYLSAANAAFAKAKELNPEIQ